METARILIIDDEEIILDAFREVLQAEGYAVTTATDGTMGLRLAEEVHPDVVLVDLKMPGISGFDVLEGLHSRDPSIVPVVVTGYATLTSAVTAMQKGAFDFIPKPCTPDELRMITRRALGRRELLRETAALRREKEMLREHFAAVVSHELKAPLAAVQQNLMLLSAELADRLSETQQGRLERLKGRLDDLLKMTDTWLRAMASDLTNIRERFQPTGIPAVVAKTLESAQPYAVRKDITLRTALPPLLNPVRGDEAALTEALLNVVHNAVKYSPAGGEVTLRVWEDAAGIHIAVQDAGVGIAPEDLPHVFDGFYRAATAGMQAGVGLGLALSRRIVEAHDGTIAVESLPGKGTTFTITLPALGAAAGRPDPSAQQPAA